MIFTAIQRLFLLQAVNLNEAIIDFEDEDFEGTWGISQEQFKNEIEGIREQLD